MYWVTGILGLALVAAPFVLGFSANPTALWTSVILGLALAVVSAIKATLQDTAKWEYGIAAILGLLAIVAPFVLGFSALVTAMWTSIILGAVVAILAGYQLFFAHS